MTQDGAAGPDFGRNPYIVAELNTSHFGKTDVAREMISTCKKIGVDCVKFQSWTDESLYADAHFKANPIAKRFFKKYSMASEELREMAAFCKSIGIGFSSTPYSELEVDFLVDECDADFIKVASMDLNNIQYLEHIAGKQVPTILSTGMGSLPEIERAVEVFEAAGHTKLCLLHCVSLYPCPMELCNLNNIVMLRDRFPSVQIGYSDHTKGPEAAVAAVALGARIIEKHFTLDSSQIGMDNQMATEPDEFGQLVSFCRNASLALGDFERKLSDQEVSQRQQMRRSAIAVRDLKTGERLQIGDVVFKRPGTGIGPDRMEDFLGRVLARDIAQGDVVARDAFQG